MKKSRVLSVHPYNDFGGGASAYTFQAEPGNEEQYADSCCLFGTVDLQQLQFRVR